jgi:DNA-binding XRE family transcriptional regulator
MDTSKYFGRSLAFCVPGRVTMVPWMQPEQILSCVMDRLAQKRARQGLSLTQLAALAGVSRSSIGMMEQGQQDMPAREAG